MLSNEMPKSASGTSALRVWNEIALALFRIWCREKRSIQRRTSAAAPPQSFGQEKERRPPRREELVATTLTASPRTGRRKRRAGRLAGKGHLGPGSGPATEQTSAVARLRGGLPERKT